jgi:hypothetical protein
MERVPISRPTSQQAERATDLTVRLAEVHHASHQAAAAVADWLRIQWHLDHVPASLASPFELSADDFAEVVRKALPKRHKMTVAEVAAETVAPIAERLTEAARLERELATVVNQAYRLTKEEEALVWRTAPPRMPISTP